MKIVIISTGIQTQPAIHGGAVETLIDMIINYNETHHLYDIIVYALYDETAEKIAKKYKNTQFRYIKRNKLIDQLYMKNFVPTRIIGHLFINKVKKYLSMSNDYEIVIVENEYSYGKIVAHKIKDIPLILHLHNDYINCTNKCINKEIKCFDGIITVSNYLKIKIREVNKNIPVKTVYNGVDLKSFFKSEWNEKRQVLREKLNILITDIVIVFAGRICKEKGIKELLRAFVKVPKKYKIKLLIIGSSVFDGGADTPFIKELKKKAKTEKDRIIFTGYVPHNKMPEYYAIADIGCVPSILDEAFGLTVIEQMAIGLPMIVSDAGAIPEIVNSNCAITVCRGEQFINGIKNAIIDLCSDEDMRRTLGNNGAIMAEKFSSQKFSVEFFNYVKDVSEGRN